MAVINLSAKTAIVDIFSDSDEAISAALSDGIAITTVHGIGIAPISNTKAKIIMLYV